MNDQILVQRALQKNNIQIDLRIVSDGDEAIDYLAGHGKFADREKFPPPKLILLDIKMPRKSGLEVLEWIRKDGSCKLIPVIIMSSSQLQTDVNRAYALGVNAYLVKPAAFEDLVALFQSATDLFVHKAAHPNHA